MLVYTLSHGELWTTVFCSWCGKEMGRFDGDEIAAMMRDGKGAICFDCDPGPAGMVPDVLRGAVLWVDGPLSSSTKSSAESGGQG